MYSRAVQLIVICKFATGERSEAPMLLSSRRQVQLLCAILEEISIIRPSSNQLLEVESHAPADIASKSSIVITIAVIRDIAESGAKADWAVMLEELRLNCKTDPQFAAFDAITHVPEHHVVCVAHSLRPQLP
jgi:hypothetical protein